MVEERLSEPGSAEASLIKACQSGRATAFEQLVRRYGPRAYRFARGMVRDAEEAKDLSQEAFIRAFQAIHRFDPRRPFYPWFYRILRNLCLSYLRSRPPVVLVDEVPEKDLRAKPELTMETRLMLQEALGSLGKDDQDILILKELQGHSYEEISGLLGIARGTVMSRLYHARRRLRSKICISTEGASLQKPLSNKDARRR